jgi:hypothetical protein
MTADRAEQAGFGASVAGHALLFAILYVGYTAVRPIQPPERKAIEVSLVAETALESGAPELSNEAPAPKLAEQEALLEPTPSVPVPEPKPAPVPQTKPLAKPALNPAPAKPAPAKPSGGRLAGILKGLTDDDSPGRSTAAPAATITPAVQSSLAAAVRRQLKPHWKAPTGADAELLRTELAIRLARDGSVMDIEVLRQTGITPSNRAQAQLHKDQAIRAVRLASPFQLPAQYYDAWKLLSPIGFDKRLSQ